jgi:hypothetical protein
MGHAHAHDSSHSTKDSTMMMQGDKTPVINSAIVCMYSVLWGIPCPMGTLYKGHQGERSPQPPEEAHFLSRSMGALLPQ